MRKLTSDGDQSTTTDVDNVIAADRLGILGVGVRDQRSDTTPGC